MISETAKVMISRFLSMRSISTPPKEVENQLQMRYYSIKMVRNANEAAGDVNVCGLER